MFYILKQNEHVVVASENPYVLIGNLSFILGLAVL